jgi:hypothetical protein
MSSRSGAMPEMIVEDDSLENDPLYSCMMRELNNMHFYYKTLMEDKWMKGMTLNQMRDKYDITLSSLSKDLKIAYEIIRTKCNCELE